MNLFEILAALITLTALFGWVNHRFLGLPLTIGLVVIALAASLGIMGLDALFPESAIARDATQALKSIDFYETLMGGLLSFLLFAGAVHVDLSDLRDRAKPVALMASFGVVLSTFVVATVIWLIAGALGLELPYIWALVFGALISPTDPVAVMSILKVVDAPRPLEATIAGESLFNDGVGVVVFSILLTIAVGHGAHGGEVGAGDVAKLFAVEALGGAVLGLIAGYLAYQLMRAIDEHNLEVMITLALATGVYALALNWHLSGPIAVVVAGIFIGNHGATFAMSERTREHVFQFWELIDEILNAVLFLLIGLEILVIGFSGEALWLGLLAIPVALGARFLAVGTSIMILRPIETFSAGAVRVLTWAGLRGGISVALALSLPETPEKPIILTATYAVVVFSIIVQGLTVEGLLRRVAREAGGS